MVTLITEKLQNQSLDDLVHKSYDADPCPAERPSSRSVHLFPFEASEDSRPWKALNGGGPIRSQAAQGPAPSFPAGPCGVSAGLGAVSAVDLRESSGPPLAPPSKRHCRSLSEPDQLARCRSPWRPGGSRVWTAVSKRRCHSGGSASLPGGAFLAAGPSSALAPQPTSAHSGFVDSGGGAGPPGCPPGPCALSSRRRLSLSQEHLVDADCPSSMPELGWRLGLPRSRSQPCVLAGRKSRLKRPREEGTRWPRPSLDFLKMTRVSIKPEIVVRAGQPVTKAIVSDYPRPAVVALCGGMQQTLKNSKSLGSLDCEGEDGAAGAETAGPSACGPRGLSGLLSPGARPRPASPRPWASREPVAGSSGDPSDGDSAGEGDALPLGHGELDLEQIENN
ncbi:protein FAM53A isoform 1-T7 [Molossus nigricans]